MSLVETLKKNTVNELKLYAKENSIDLFGTSTKAEILETILNFVPLEEFPSRPKEEKKEKSGEKIAVYSSRDLFWSQVGELKFGYNIVSKEDSEKWLTHKAVRTASPEEVARHYGKQ